MFVNTIAFAQTQTFWQAASFKTNLFLYDSTVPLHLRLSNFARTNDTRQLNWLGADIRVTNAVVSTQPVNLEQMQDAIAAASGITVYGSTNAHPIGGSSLTLEVPTTAWAVTNTLADGTNLVGTFWFTNTSTIIREGNALGRFYTKKLSGTKTANGYMCYVYTYDDGATTNIMDTSAQSGNIIASVESYLLTVNNPTNITGTNLYFGVCYFLVQTSGGSDCEIVTYGGGPYDTQLKIPGIGRATGYLLPGDPGTSTNLGDYNNNVGFITNAASDASAWSGYPATQAVEFATFGLNGLGVPELSFESANAWATIPSSIGNVTHLIYNDGLTYNRQAGWVDIGVTNMMWMRQTISNATGAISGNNTNRMWVFDPNDSRIIEECVFLGNPITGASGSNIAVGIGCQPYRGVALGVYGDAIIDGDVAWSGVVKDDIDLNWNSISNVGTLTTTNLIIEGTNPTSNAVWTSTGTDGKGEWRVRQSTTIRDTTSYQTTNALEHTVICGFKPNHVDVMAHVNGSNIVSMGWCTLSGAYNCLYSSGGGWVSIGRTARIEGPGGADDRWSIAGMTFLTNGISFTASETAVDTDLDVRILFKFVE